MTLENIHLTRPALIRIGTRTEVRINTDTTICATIVASIYSYSKEYNLNMLHKTMTKECRKRFNYLDFFKNSLTEKKNSELHNKGEWL
jgi:hypothetical protein